MDIRDKSMATLKRRKFIIELLKEFSRFRQVNVLKKLTQSNLCQKECLFFQSLGKTLEKRAHWRGVHNKLTLRDQKKEGLFLESLSQYSCGNLPASFPLNNLLR